MKEEIISQSNNEEEANSSSCSNSPALTPAENENKPSFVSNCNENNISEGSPARSNNILSKDSSGSDVSRSSESAEPKSKNLKNGRVSKKRVKEYKSLEQIQKDLLKISDVEGKLSFIINKYGELFNEYLSLHNIYKGNEKKMVTLQKEKESLQTDYSKAILARSRLEDLCRELQRQNRIVKEESLSRVREEEEKRKEASGKFQTALNDISVMLQDNQTQSAKLQEENMEMAKKLKVLFDQYHLREKHVEKLIQHREIENKLSDTKIAKMQATVAEEKEHNMIEKKKLLEELMTLQKKCTELAGNELKARTELKSYKDKYEEFQDNLKKSNSVFDSFKSEMNKMSKKIGKLEKETLDWQGRWKSSNKALITMAEDKQKSDQQLIQSQQKILKLESLCRALQHERNDLRSNLSKSSADKDSFVADEEDEATKPKEETSSEPPQTSQPLDDRNAAEDQETSLQSKSIDN